jgi:hypothetical protein
MSVDMMLSLKIKFLIMLLDIFYTLSCLSPTSHGDGVITFTIIRIIILMMAKVMFLIELEKREANFIIKLEHPLENSTNYFKLVLF